MPNLKEKNKESNEVGAGQPTPIFTNGWENFEKWRKQAISENTEEKQRLPQWFKPGESGNPAGRPKGAENFKTVFERALKNVAEINKIEPDALYAQIIAKGIQLASKGDYRFYKDILDRVHGKPQEKMDLTTDGEKIDMGNKIAFINCAKKDKE